MDVDYKDEDYVYPDYKGRRYRDYVDEEREMETTKKDYVD